MNKSLEWTSNDILYLTDSKMIVGQVQCAGANDFRASACGMDLGRFVDREVAKNRVIDTCSTRMGRYLTGGMGH